jgi:hypothetical protein
MAAMTELFENRAAWLGLFAVLFLAMIAALEAGRAWGRARKRVDADGPRAGVAGIEAAVFGLLRSLSRSRSPEPPRASRRGAR